MKVEEKFVRNHFSNNITDTINLKLEGKYIIFRIYIPKRTVILLKEWNTRCVKYNCNNSYIHT